MTQMRDQQAADAKAESKSLGIKSKDMASRETIITYDEAVKCANSMFFCFC